jgi:hypothetical protein
MLSSRTGSKPERAEGEQRKLGEQIGQAYQKNDSTLM